MTEVISSYEQLRLDNIKRNQLELERLGIFTAKPKPVKVKTKSVARKRAKVEVSPDYGARRLSSRNSLKPPGFFNEASQFNIKREDDDSDEDYDDDGYKNAEVYDEKSIPYPTKRARVNKELAILSNMEEVDPVIKIEKAKTGRSSCRKCRENIDQDTMRVGMKAWIMGRNSWTWSHPACFTSLITLNRDSGRGKCKITSSKFDSNEIKVTCSSHTATVNMCVTAAVKVLEDVLKEDPSYSISTLIATLDGISEEEESTIREAFQCPSKLQVAMVSPEDTEEDEEDKIKIKTNLTKQDQPVAGVKTGSKGQVAWKFGGNICYGILIPKSETETHCYAKTHKGNVKTLTKGLSSWWLLG